VFCSSGFAEGNETKDGVSFLVIGSSGGLLLRACVWTTHFVSRRREGDRDARRVRLSHVKIAGSRTVCLTDSTKIDAEQAPSCTLP